MRRRYVFSTSCGEIGKPYLGERLLDFLVEPENQEERADVRSILKLARRKTYRLRINLENYILYACEKI